MIPVRVETPTLHCDINAFSRLLRHQTLQLDVTWRAPVSDDFWVPDRLRSAWGNALLKREREGDLDATACLDLCFRLNVVRAGGTQLAKPFVVTFTRLDTYRGFRVTLTLFGIACRLATTAFESFQTGLRRGVRCDPQKTSRAPMTIESSAVIFGEGVRSSHRDWTTRLSYSTPLFVQKRWQDLIFCAAQRAKNLAPWEGIELDVDFGELRAEIEQVAVLDDSRMRLVVWPRKDVRWTAFIGEVDLEGITDALWPFLELALLVLTGPRAALGAGRFQLRAAV